jgi:3-dehydroquinate dehydratase-2
MLVPRPDISTANGRAAGISRSARLRPPRPRIVINPAAFSFTSIAILDALKMFPGPIIELHISNIHRREAIYHHSLVSKVATAVIAGLGPTGYAAAMKAMTDLLATRQDAP